MIKFVVFEGRFDLPGTYIVLFYFLNGQSLRKADEQKEHCSGNDAEHVNKRRLTIKKFQLRSLVRQVLKWPDDPLSETAAGRVATPT